MEKSQGILPIDQVSFRKMLKNPQGDSKNPQGSLDGYSFKDLQNTKGLQDCKCSHEKAVISHGSETPQKMAANQGPFSFNPVLDLFFLENSTPETPLDKYHIYFPRKFMFLWGLPSLGEQTNESCGVFFQKGCLEIQNHPEGKAVFHPRVKRCFSPKCPICWKSWVFREAERIAYRFQESGQKGKPIHVTVSPPRSEWGKDPSELRRKSYVLAKKVGFFGGSCIFHPFRQNKVSGEWYFSPHFHLIGFGWIKGTAHLHSHTGYVIKNIKVRKSVFGTAFYQLTHAGIFYGPNKKHTVTWFGSMGYNKLKIPKKPEDPEKCPYCDTPLYALQWIGEGEMPLPFKNSLYLADAQGWIYKLSLHAVIPALQDEAMLFI